MFGTGEPQVCFNHSSGGSWGPLSAQGCTCVDWEIRGRRYGRGKGKSNYCLQLLSILSQKIQNTVFGCKVLFLAFQNASYPGALQQ